MRKRFLVTGAAGFIGSNLVRKIFQTYPDANVVSYDLLTYAGNLHNLEDIEKNETQHKFVKGNIGDTKKVEDLLNSFKPDTVLHLAAETHVDRSIKNSHIFIETNVTAHNIFLEALHKYYALLPENKQEHFRFIHISTDEVFGELDKDSLPFHEETPYAPRSPYAASKAAGDHLTRAWNHTYGLPAIIINCSNNYGPYQYPEKLIPLMISNAIGNRPLPVYGEGKQVRDWLYVEDHCAAILCATEKGKEGETYCIGGNSEKRNIDVVETICDILDRCKPRKDGISHREGITFVADRPGHDYRYAINSSKAQKELDWQAGTNFASGLETTVLWYINNQPWCTKVQSAEYRTWIESNYVDRITS